MPDVPGYRRPCVSSGPRHSLVRKVTCNRTKMKNTYENYVHRFLVMKTNGIFMPNHERSF